MPPAIVFSVSHFPYSGFKWSLCGGKCRACVRTFLANRDNQTMLEGAWCRWSPRLCPKGGEVWGLHFNCAALNCGVVVLV